jgi:hypothetical protein
MSEKTQAKAAEALEALNKISGDDSDHQWALILDGALSGVARGDYSGLVTILNQVKERAWYAQYLRSANSARN